MTYVVTKIIKGNPYLYLVRSERDGDRVRQIFVRYLGRADSEEAQAKAARWATEYVAPVARRGRPKKLAPTTEAVTTEETARVDIALREFEQREKARIPTKDEYVERRLAEYKSAVEGSGFPLDVKKQTEIIKNEYDKKYPTTEVVTPPVEPKEEAITTEQPVEPEVTPEIITDATILEKDYARMSHKEVVEELKSQGKPLLTDDTDRLNKLANYKQGYKPEIDRPTFIFKGIEEGVITDGFLLVESKEAAEDIFGKFIESEKKKQVRKDMKLNPNLTEEDARENVDRYFEAQYGGGTFPDYKRLYPTELGSEVKLIGVYAGGLEGIEIPTETETLAYLSDGEHIMAVNADKLAFVLKHLPDAKMFFAPDNQTTRPLTFVVGDKHKGLLMPMAISDIPPIVQEKVIGFIPEKPKPAEPAKSEPRKPVKVDPEMVEAILEGYSDLNEAKEALKEFADRGIIGYTAKGQEVTPDMLRQAINIKSIEPEVIIPTTERVGFQLPEEWEKIISNANDYGGEKGVTEIIERSGLTRESKDNLIAQLKSKIPTTETGMPKGEVRLPTPDEIQWRFPTADDFWFWGRKNNLSEQQISQLWNEAKIAEKKLHGKKPSEVIIPTAEPSIPETKKEPWEMTREEYRDFVVREYPFEIVNLKSTWLPGHKLNIEQALSEGKSVPPEVLKDYPELAPKPEAPELPIEPEVTKPKATITQYELGGIRYKEVRLEGRPSVSVARTDEGLSEDALIERAKQYWDARDKQESIASNLRAKHNRQVYVGALPTIDIETSLSGEYAYVLKDRRKGGKYQILEAVNLESVPETTKELRAVPPPKPEFTPETKAKTNWQLAQDEASRLIENIESEWVTKTHTGVTQEQQTRIDNAITETAQKYKVPEGILRKNVLWEASVEPETIPPKLTEKEIDELVASVGFPEAKRKELRLQNITNEIEHLDKLIKDKYSTISRVGYKQRREALLKEKTELESEIAHKAPEPTQQG